MNISDNNRARVGKKLALAAAVSFVVAGCVTAPTASPDGSAEVRGRLSALQSDPNLASKAPVEIREAEVAVAIAEKSVSKDDVALVNHRVYMANRKVDIAMAKATARYTVDQRAVLSQERDKIRLDARTQEADVARRQATIAQDKAEAERAMAKTAAASAAASAATAASTAATAATAAETAATMAAIDAAESARNANRLQQQIKALKAEATDRGLVLTLGGVLFATGRSDLTSGGNATLDKLVTFLNEYPDRNVAIEGHTDDVGSLELNQTLSQHRADAVKAYLTGNGIQSARVSASGMGETHPVADNNTASGRQQNRRVEVLIKNPPAAVPAVSVNESAKI
jgi:outer membrane protein OmpA-like peptidoglycan-associated protein